MRLRIGTRGSQLALKQTDMVVAALLKKDPSLDIEIKIIRSTGDRITDRPLASIGGKGLFVQEFEQALKQDTIDCAVHSGKDLPSVLDDGFCIPAVLPRADARDVLISRSPIQNYNAICIGTASPRRTVLAKRMFAGCEIKLLRGNVQTRLEALHKGYDAILLAKAGLDRLHIDVSGYVVKVCDPHVLIPASCQGIIAIESKVNARGNDLLATINDENTHCVFDWERNLMAAIHADCHDAAAVHIEMGDPMHIWAFYQNSRIVHRQANRETMDAVIQEMAGDLLG